MNDIARVIVLGMLFVFIFLSGIWVSRTGRPLSMARSTIHKLIGLAAGVLLLVTIFQQNQVAPLAGPAWLAVVITGVCFAAIVASGGVLSSDKPRPVTLLRIHQLVPILTVLATAMTLYLVLGQP